MKKCMRPWIRRYRFYWIFAPRGRLSYEAYNVVPFKVTFLITFRNDLLTIISKYLLKTLHVYYFSIPMSTHQADMSTKIRFVKTDDAFIINYNTK